jgi:transcriptional regulator with XRE-family HTH domain
MSRSYLSNYLRTERLRSGLSQRELGELLGFTDSIIGKVEIGRRKPSFEIILMAEIIFGKPRRELFPDIVMAIEDAVLLRAVAIESRLALRTDAVSKRKCAHLSALINRLQFHLPPS